VFRLDGGSVPSATLLNATLLTRQLDRRLELSASVYNLLDKTTYDPPGGGDPERRIAQDGRSLRLQLTFHLGGGR
jgi:outer membrane receptor protein involved in Fe transport